ncbi:hypothetical protein MSMEI_6471 [Mycolicibacterium smegmatis MC2 155]|uniref:Uncharacterized protein n=1 Tax=Mycolicibacterium smegmatis (strain ATCC 700084 / mc(2)155) TaxID=246196 RepID=I7GBC6_MYCS2|nr:hypothetical protein MSMEI_6471 [Mycolicibacterium smegmatis MC2 155]
MPVGPARRSLLLGGLLGLLLGHIFQCRHHGPFTAEHRSACQSRKHRQMRGPANRGSGDLLAM